MKIRTINEAYLFSSACLDTFECARSFLCSRDSFAEQLSSVQKWNFKLELKKKIVKNYHRNVGNLLVAVELAAEHIHLTNDNLSLKLALLVCAYQFSSNPQIYFVRMKVPKHEFKLQLKFIFYNKYFSILKNII